MDVLLWVVTGVVALGVAVGALARVVALDGYDGGAPPRSHHDPWCGGTPDERVESCACR